jgi:hypothetical protein
MVVPAGPVRDGGSVDPFVKVRRGRRHGQAAQERQQPRGPANLGRAGRAAVDVGGQARGVLRRQLVHQERVDQVTRASVIEGRTDRRSLAHIL